MMVAVILVIISRPFRAGMMYYLFTGLCPVLIYAALPGLRIMIKKIILGNDILETL
jgi:hypothetical protein